ncbi:PLP-dependent aminotransferase family protein [Pseudoruegeria sp. HB172150]|uniref:aminotransferase-like domain-containing protein n=1 Tax=Pseudoruegeria sp. HB172150 TaxID=2721164 RepID=UPI0020A6DA65|nr:PLP-dependent aminotransferase family protein [Pseudoruegeria sp. HB172150]
MNTIWEPSIEGRGGPKYKAVVEAIREAVSDGDLEVGAKLPPVRELAWQLSITPGTVARAYTILTDDGVLEAAVGRGTFVAAQDHAAPISVPVSRPDIEASEETEGPVRLYGASVPDVGQVALIRELMVSIGQNGGVAGLLDYPDRDTKLPLREAAIRWMAGSHLGPLDPGDVVISNGGQNALVLTLQACLRGDAPVILVEELFYPGFRRAAELVRAQVIPVPMDGFGIVPEALEELALKHGAQALMTSPEVHNPTTLCTPPWRRQEIADVARRTGLQLVEDDCYRMGPGQGLPYRAMLPEQSWYISSLSKLLTPSLRVGFAVAPRGRGARLRRMAEYNYFGLAAPMVELVVGIMTWPGLPDLTSEVRRVINQYSRVALNVLGGYQISWREDVPFLWLRLPAGWRAGAFCQAAEARGVQVRSAEEFVVREGRAPHAIRISMNARIGMERFERALVTLRELLDNPPENISF